MSYSTTNRQLVAAIAAHGILGHNSAQDMPAALTLKQVHEKAGVPDSIALRPSLDHLVDLGLLHPWRTFAWTPYSDTEPTWQITEKGLMWLWGGLS